MTYISNILCCFEQIRNDEGFGRNVFFEEIIFIRLVINISENMHITFFRLRIGSRFVLQKSVCRLLSVSIETLVFSLFSKKKKVEMKNKAIEKFFFPWYFSRCSWCYLFSKLWFSRMWKEWHKLWERSIFFQKCKLQPQIFNSWFQRSLLHVSCKRFSRKIRNGRCIFYFNFFQKALINVTFFSFFNSFSQYTWVATSASFSKIFRHPAFESQIFHKHAQ